MKYFRYNDYSENGSCSLKNQSSVNLKNWRCWVMVLWPGYRSFIIRNHVPDICVTKLANQWQSFKFLTDNFLAQELLIILCKVICSEAKSLRCTEQRRSPFRPFKETLFHAFWIENSNISVRTCRIVYWAIRIRLVWSLINCFYIIHFSSQNLQVF